MKFLSTIFAITVSIFMGTAQETRSLDNFDEVGAQAGIKVILVESNENKAVVEVENCEPEDVVTEVRGGDLTVKFKSNLNWNGRGRNRKATVTVHYSSALSGISVSSGARIESRNMIKSNNLELEGSSGGMMKLTVDASSIDAGASSGGILDIEGSTRNLDVDVSSGGIVRAYDLSADTADADASSGGVANFTVTKSLTAEASSGGSISYKGKPQSVKVDAGFSGSIKSRD